MKQEEVQHATNAGQDLDAGVNVLTGSTLRQRMECAIKLHEGTLQASSQAHLSTEDQDQGHQQPVIGWPSTQKRVERSPRTVTAHARV